MLNVSDHQLKMNKTILLIVSAFILVATLSLVSSYSPPNYTQIDLVLTYSETNYTQIDLVLDRTTITDTCSCPSINANWNISLSDSCNVTTTCNIGTGNISFYGTGYTMFNSTINCKNIVAPPSTGQLKVGSLMRLIVG